LDEKKSIKFTSVAKSDDFESLIKKIKIQVNHVAQFTVEKFCIFFL